jgi:hypothetical protein
MQFRHLIPTVIFSIGQFVIKGNEGEAELEGEVMDHL